MSLAPTPGAPVTPAPGTVLPPVPTYAQLLGVVIAAMEATAVVAENGQTVLLDMTPGSHNLALATAVAAVVAALYQRQSDLETLTDFDSATGTYLDAIVAEMNLKRFDPVAATKPVLIGRQQVAATAVEVPVGWPFTIQTSQGPVEYTALQGQAEPPGVALTVQSGSQWGWVLGQAFYDAVNGPDYRGVVGNTPTGLPAQFGATLPGLDTLLNPAATTPPAPTYTISGSTGSSTRLYRAVGNGVTGKTLPGAILTVSNAPATPSPSNAVNLTLTFSGDGATTLPQGVDWLLSLDGGTTWQLLGTTLLTAAVATFSDSGVVPQPYTLPTSDTSNWGVGGADEEGNTALRTRAQNAVAARSAATNAGVSGAVANVAGVAAATAADTGNGLGVVNVVPSAYPPSATVLAAINAAIATNKALGANVQAVIVQPTLVSVTFSVIAAQSVADPTTLETPVETAITAYMNGLALGAPVRFSAVIGAMMGVSGVAAVQSLSFAVGSSTYAGSDVPANPRAVYRAGTYTPSASH